MCIGPAGANRQRNKSPTFTHQLGVWRASQSLLSARCRARRCVSANPSLPSAATIVAGQPSSGAPIARLMCASITAGTAAAASCYVHCVDGAPSRAVSSATKQRDSSAPVVHSDCARRAACFAKQSTPSVRKRCSAAIVPRCRSSAAMCASRRCAKRHSFTASTATSVWRAACRARRPRRTAATHVRKSAARAASGRAALSARHGAAFAATRLCYYRAAWHLVACSQSAPFAPSSARHAMPIPVPITLRSLAITALPACLAIDKGKKANTFVLQEKNECH